LKSFCAGFPRKYQTQLFSTKTPIANALFSKKSGECHKNIAYLTKACALFFS